MDTHQSLKNKNGGWRRVKKKSVRLPHALRPNFRGQIQSATHIYKIAIMGCIIT